MPGSERTIAALNPGNHLCLIYGSEREHREALTPFLRQGLERGEKVVCILNLHSPEAILDYLKQDGLDPLPYLASGQLALLSSNEAYTHELPFDPDRMIGFLKVQTEQALEEGYVALRITGEMSWALEGLPGSDRLIEYEAKLHRFFEENRCLALCQYDRRRFPPELLLDVLRTHPLVVIGTGVYENFYYIPPELAADELAHWLGNLVRLHHDVHRRAEGLATVAEVAEQIASILDMDLLLREAVERAVERLGYDYAAIMLLDEEAGDLVFRVGAGEFAGKTPPGFRQRLEEGMIGWVAAHGETLLANDVSQEPRYISAYLSETRSELDVPLKVRGQVIGVLDLQSSRLNAFDQNDVLVMEALAGHLATAIENARLFQEEQRRREEAETLRELGSLLTSSLDPDRVLRTLLDRLGRLVSYDRATVMLLEGDTLRVVAAHGYEAIPYGEGMADRRIPLAESPLLARVVELGETVQVTDVSTDPIGYADPRPLTTSWIGVPLTVRGLVVGMVSVARTGSPPFTGEDARLAAAVADHAAVAIENAYLYQELRTYATGLEERVRERTAELRRERERIQAILDHAGQGVIVTDNRGVIQYMNPAAERITGYTAEESVGKMPVVWGGEGDPAELHREMWQTVLSGQVWQGEFSYRRKDGARYYAAMTVAPIPGEGGELAGFVGIVEDITAIKELNRLKTRFVSDAAHELRTPVTTIKLYVSLLQREHREEKRAEYLEMLARETDLMVQLVQDLLDISRMEAGVARFEPEPVDMNGLVQEVAERYRERARLGGIALSFELAPDLPPVMADREQMDRVVTNLLTNALNYTQPGGRVVVRTAIAGDQVQVAVADTGYGIPEEEQKQVFERFFRGSAARRSGVAGTGLGLSIVHEILRMHGGGIKLESRVGEGSTFTFWLPPG